MRYRVSLDTFHTGIKCDFADVEDVLLKIKKNLFFIPEARKSKNPYYLYGWQYPDIGFNVYFDTKSGLANCPISIELNGKFFRLQEFAEKFVDWLFSEFELLPQRADACIDCIYTSLDDLEQCEIYDDKYTFTLGFPVPSFKPDFKYKVGPFEGHFDLLFDDYNYGHVVIDLLTSGRGELKLRVYDKDKDIHSKDGVSVSYTDIYGIDSIKCYRIEFAVRSDSLKHLFSKYDLNNSSSLVYVILSSMFKRYSFLNCKLDDVFNEDVSFYLSKKDSDLENQITDCLNKLRKESDRYIVLNKKKYKETCNGLSPDNLFSRRNYLRQIDFYNAFEKLEKVKEV